MLPFLNKSKEASVSMPPDSIKRKSDDEDGEQEYDSLHSAAEDLIHAVHSKDVAAVAMAIKAAFEICDSQPHEEGPHE